MSSVKNTIIRIRTIDTCLKSKEKNYFMKDLIDECSAAVYEYKKRIDPDHQLKLISKRTIQYDLEIMKSEYPGFEAPILSDRDEGFYYGEPGFEIFKAGISQTDIERLSNALDILRQLSEENQFTDLASLVHRLEATYRIKRKLKEDVIIQFDQGNNIEGQKWVDKFKAKITDKEAISMSYQPFGKEKYQRVISPYQIREYNDRWFCIGYDHDKAMITNIGLDRVKSVGKSLMPYHIDKAYNSKTHLIDVVGVSKHPETRKTKIRIRAWGLMRFYLESKKLHYSQTPIEENEEYTTFELDVFPNFELESKILANADALEIISPDSFRDRIARRLERAQSYYS